MTLKKFAFTSLLLSSVFLVACQPTEEQPETQEMMFQDTTSVEEESIMMEGTDQPIPGEESMMLQNNTMDETPTPTATPIMDTSVETEVEM